MTPQESCRKLLELAGKATKGPWSVARNIGDLCYVNCGQLLTNTGLPTAIATRIETNADFIAFSRNHGPQIAQALIVAIEALEADCTGHADCNNPGCRTVNKIDALFGGGD